jgi:NADH-quinone oxidoreductase subunit L
VGSGAYVAAIFHMVTHAFFKALLFLGAGSVIHGLHDEQDMYRMGGLRKWMPITSATFIVGWLAIAGVPPFSGFWSKDEILASAWDKSPILWAVGLVTALLTAYYMSRQVFLVFFGEDRWKQAADRHTPHEAAAEPEHEPAAAKHGAHGDFDPHESPPTMAIPLIVLAALAAIGGLLNLPFGGYVLEHFLEPVFGEHVHHLSLSSGTKLVLALIATAAALAGIATAFLTYMQKRLPTVEPAVLQHAWYVDDAYDKAIAQPGRAAAAFGADVIDAKVIDGAVNGVGVIVRVGGSGLRRIQTGFVRNYALAISVGAVGVLAYMLARS